MEFRDAEPPLTADPEPDLHAGIAYWENTPATVDGVLGGFGTGSLPRVDALGSRQFLQELLTYTVQVPSAIRLMDAPPVGSLRRTRALDVGAGIGRVTSTVLLHLFDDIVIVEPVKSFVDEAMRAADSGKWKGITHKGSTKSVSFCQGPLQSFNPMVGVEEQSSDFVVERIGKAEGSEADETGFDVVWCQWALGHLSDSDLVAFFKRAKLSLRGSPTGHPREDGYIIVKENICQDGPNDSPAIEFDHEDSSVTRSHFKWLQIFEQTELTLVVEKIQHGLPAGLYPVRMYALR